MKFFVPLPRPDRAPESLSSGSSDSLGRGMDVALTLLAFLLLGWLLDSWLGTAPLFMIVLSVLSAVGQFIRMKYVYDAEMERLEAQRLAGRRTPGRPSGSLEDAA